LWPDSTSSLFDEDDALGRIPFGIHLLKKGGRLQKPFGFPAAGDACLESGPFRRARALSNPLGVMREVEGELREPPMWWSRTPRSEEVFRHRSSGRLAF
jgi:hypothetical protein